MLLISLGPSKRFVWEKKHAPFLTAFYVPTNIDTDNMTKAMTETHIFPDENPTIYLIKVVGGDFELL
jgi:hypothetical protein